MFPQVKPWATKTKDGRIPLQFSNAEKEVLACVGLVTPMHTGIGTNSLDSCRTELHVKERIKIGKA
jgi:hypothetical protein